jgi:hypothetical protein
MLPIAINDAPLRIVSDCPQSWALEAAHGRALADRKLVGCKCACPLPPAPTSDANSRRHATATFSRTHLTSEVWPVYACGLGGEPYPVSTFSIDHTTGKLTHLDATLLVDQMAYVNVGAKVAVPDRRALYRRRQGDPDHRLKAHCVFIDAGNKHAYVPVLGAEYAMQFKFDLPAPAC